MKHGGFFAIVGAIVTALAVFAGVFYYLKKTGKLQCSCCEEDLDDDLMEYIEDEGGVVVIETEAAPDAE